MTFGMATFTIVPVSTMVKAATMPVLETSMRYFGPKRAYRSSTDSVTTAMA